MKKLISTFLIINILSFCALAQEFDSSIDANIRKEYNVDASSLPALPKVVPTAAPNVSEIPKSSYNVTGKTYTVKRGTKIVLSSKNKITDWSAKGSKISFIAQQGITTKEGAIIPAGTIFKGTITDSHHPQISGNGGLVELKIDEIYYNGVFSNIETKLAEANSKRVFRSDIKGERRYWKNFSKAMTPGKKTFEATRTCASVMAPIPVVNILSVVPLLGGSVVYVSNLVVAPVIAIFTKGGSVSLPAGTHFQIKFTKDTKING